jgi:glycosyltransferase involved in cell wall biosynthesis
MPAEPVRSREAHPLVTVVVPVFNGAHFLARALHSIEAQEYEPLQVVVVDDGSTDETYAVATDIARRHSWEVIQHENRGVAAARNTGLGAARGELVTFLDADDEMVPDRIQFQVEHLAANPECGVVIGAADTVLDGGDPPSWLPELASPARTPPFVQGSMMVRAHLFHTVGLFNTAYRVGEDTEWIARAMTAGVRLAFAERVLIRRHVHEANLSHRLGERHDVLFRLFREQLAEKRRAHPVEGHA